MLLAVCTFYVSVVVFYVADALQKRSSVDQNTWNYLAIRSVYTTSFALLITLVLFGPRTFPPLAIVMQLMGCSFLCGFGLYYYIKAINTLNFSNVGSLYIIGNVIQNIVGILFFKELFYITDLLAFVLMSFGSIYQLLFSQSFKGAKYVIASSAFWTAGYILLSFVLKRTSINWSVPVMEFSILIMSLSIICVRGGLKQLKNCIQLQEQIRVLDLLIIAIFIYGGSFLNNYTFQNLPISSILIFQLSMMPVGYLVSLKIFKEAPNKIELLSFVSGWLGFLVFILKRAVV